MIYVWQQPEWPHFHLDISAVAGLVRRYKSLCSDASKAYGLLEKQAQRTTLIEWLVSEAISTSAIEGESLNRKDVRSSILNHLGIHDPPLRVGDPRAEGVAALVLDVRKNANESLTPDLLFQWQSMIVQPRSYLKEPPKSPDRVSSALQGPLKHFSKPYCWSSQRIRQSGLVKNRSSAHIKCSIGHFGRTYPV